jgi:hypothetical protein
MLELEVKAHVLHLLKDVVMLDARFDWHTAASADGQSIGPGATSVSHSEMQVRAGCSGPNHSASAAMGATMPTLRMFTSAVDMLLRACWRSFWILVGVSA